MYKAHWNTKDLSWQVIGPTGLVQSVWVKQVQASQVASDLNRYLRRVAANKRSERTGQ